jgi:hypothetical protein
MLVSAILGSEEPPSGSKFRTQIILSARKTFYLLYNLPPKMHKFHEWHMKNSAKSLEIFGILARPEDFATEGERVVWLEFKDIYEVYHLDTLILSRLVSVHL